MMKEEMIRVQNVRKVYLLGDEKVVALNKINFSIYRGELCCIFGTSGSGKSTLLNQLAGLEKPTKGEVLLNGISITKLNESQMAGFRQEHIGFVFQAYNLLPYMTAIENVALPLMFHGIPEEARNAAAARMLKKVGLEKRMYHYPGQMSGGQQQRVGIARAFVAKPEVIFADEPTGNLDTKTTAQIMGMMKEMADKQAQTIILVTHDPEMAGYADRIIKLIDGDIVADYYQNAEEKEQAGKEREKGTGGLK